MEFAIANAVPLLIIATLAGLAMAWAIGANDVANAMGTSVGSGALTMKQAIVVAAVFEFAGAVVAGASVSGTIRKGIVDPQAFAGAPEQLMYGMIAALLAAATWLGIATQKGWPVSTTHSIVGSIVGFSLLVLGADAIHWPKLGSIAASWVTSPLIAGTLAFVLFRLIQRLILSANNPYYRTRKSAPFLVFLTTIILSLVTLWKGLKHFDLDLNLLETAGVAVVFSLAAAGVASLLVSRLPKVEEDPNDRFGRVERIFAILQIYTACAVAFAHGSNDTANAVGPWASVFTTAREGLVATKSVVPLWMLILGGIGIVIGLATYGYRVMDTVGNKITHLTPSRGYTAEFAAATTIVVASRMGLPISTTHTLVGAVLGVGLARGVASTNLRVMGQIAMSWVVTIPAGAILAIGFYSVLDWVF